MEDEFEALVAHARVVIPLWVSAAGLRLKRTEPALESESKLRKWEQKMTTRLMTALDKCVEMRSCSNNDAGTSSEVETSQCVAGALQRMRNSETTNVAQIESRLLRCVPAMKPAWCQELPTSNGAVALQVKKARRCLSDVESPWPDEEIFTSKLHRRAGSRGCEDIAVHDDKIIDHG